MSAKIQRYRTAESVSPKHPDKICDQISDAILDAHLKEDPNARVAVDVAGGHGTVFVTGEISSHAKNVNNLAIVRRIAGDVEVIDHVSEQSPEIARGVDTGGAGDQGIMVGYACDETAEKLPLEVVISRKLNQAIFEKWPFDGKTQVTLAGSSITGVVASFQNAEHDELDAFVRDFVDAQIAEYSLQQGDYTTYINPCGDWHLGGFDADAGLTGRKLAVDNYGPRIPVGGGAFSGKDPSKVDRSGAYMARRIAVDYLQRNHAKEVYVWLAYSIGVAEPLEAIVQINDEVSEIEGYDLTPNGIIKSLDLRKPIYENTARYGHFGHGYNWEIPTIELTN